MQSPIDPTLEQLQTQLQSTDPTEREKAIRALSNSTNRDSINILMNIIRSDPDPNLRKLASDAARQVQANANKAGGGTTAKPVGTVSASLPGTILPIGNGPTAHAAAGPKAFQMLWDCPFCGTKKLLGIDHKFCPNCGAPQKPEMRYFPSEADKIAISDPKYTYAGVDKECPFCHQPNSANAKFCSSCGGDLTNAKHVDTKGAVLTGSAQHTGQVEDLTLKKFQAEQNAVKAKKQRQTVNRILIGVFVVVAAIIGIVFALSKSTYNVSIEVSQMSWQRNIAVEQLNPVFRSDWRDSVPVSAYNLSCHPEQRPYQVSEEYECGTTKQDRGDGSFVEVPKMCNRTHTEYRSDSKCNYTIDVWESVQTLTESGDQNKPLVWPDFNPALTTGIGAQRGNKSQNLSVVFKDLGANAKDKTYTQDLTGMDGKDEATWKTYQVGQRYTVLFNRLNQIDWNSLKLVSGSAS